MVESQAIKAVHVPSPIQAKGYYLWRKKIGCVSEAHQQIINDRKEKNGQRRGNSLQHLSNPFATNVGARFRESRECDSFPLRSVSMAPSSLSSTSKSRSAVSVRFATAASARPKLFRLCVDGEIESVHRLKPGQAKGIRLINKKSLDAYIRSFLPGGKRYQKSAASHAAKL